MLITIYTDASFHPQNKQAGGAAWIRSEKGLIKFHTSFGADNSTHAEAIIALRAIKRAYHEWDNATVMFVNTDSMGLCKCMWPFTADSASGSFGVVVDAIKKYCDDKDLETRFKHVKGHNYSGEKEDIRGFLNYWCDKNAGINRRNQTENKSF